MKSSGQENRIPSDVEHPREERESCSNYNTGSNKKSSQLNDQFSVLDTPFPDI